MNKHMSFTVAVLFMAATVFAQAQPAAKQSPGPTPETKTQRYVNLLSSSKSLKGSVWGMLAVTASGDTVARWNPDTRMVPASNVKLITTGTALHSLGPGFRFETSLGYTGKVEDGTLKGDLYIVGGGDPTLASGDSCALPADSLFACWKGFLDKAGIKRIDGRVIGDGRFFDGAPEATDWSWEDIGTAYGTGGNGLCFYRNKQDFLVKAGAKAGDKVDITIKYPQTPWMTTTFNTVTGKAGTGDQLYLYTSDLAPVAQVRGSFAMDRKPKTEEFSNKYGALTCAYYFYRYLEDNGIPVSGCPADINCRGSIREDPASEEGSGWASAPRWMTMVGTTYSPRLKEIARITNHRSDNFYAETLLRMEGKRFKGCAAYDTSLVVQDSILRAMGISTAQGVRLSDGSGLARTNCVSPAFFTAFLRTMMDDASFDDYLASIPQPGSGTLVSRLANEPAGVRKRVHMKSGSMEGTLCFSGYILAQNGRKEDTVIFSIMTNNTTAKQSEVSPVLDRIIGLLASENAAPAGN